MQKNWWPDESGDFDFCAAYSSSSEKEAAESQVLLDLAGKGTAVAEYSTLMLFYFIFLLPGHKPDKNTSFE